MKKTGKVLSLVLSLALVASSLTATFASAAPASETGTVDDVTLYVVNGGTTTDELTSPDIALKMPTSAKLNDNSTTSTLVLKDVVVTSGSGLATVKNARKTDGSIDTSKLVLANKNVQGDVVLATRYEGTVTRTGNTDASKVYVQGKVTVKILKAGTAVIVKGADTSVKNTSDDATLNTNAFTTYPDALDSLAKTNGDVVYGKVMTVTHGGDGTDATPVWTLQPVVVTTAVASKYCITTSGVGVDADLNEADGNGFKLTSKADVSKAKFSAVGSIAVHAQNYDASKNPLNETKDKANTTTYVTNKVKAADGMKTISSYQGGTYLSTAAITSTPTLGATTWNISGSDVDFTDVGANDVTVSGGSVGKITGVPAAQKADQKITVEDGTIGSIVVDSDVVVKKGSVGDITSKKTVTVNNGKTGNITATEAAGAITITASGEDAKVITGDLKTKTLSISATNDANVKVGKITTLDAGTVELGGKNVTVGTIDNDYNATTLTFNSFTGKINTPVNAFALGSGVSKFMTVVANGDSKVTFADKAYIYGLTVNDTSEITFADAVKLGANGVSGSGVIAFAPGALYSEGSVSGVSVKLTKAFKKGDVAFTAATDAAYVGAFTPYGFTVEKTAGTKIDTFKIASVDFAGIDIVGSSIIEVGKTETYTAVSYPEGTKLPAGETVKWTFDGNTDYLVATADEKDSSKITIKAVKKDGIFQSLNMGVLTAKVYDAYGYEDYSYKAATFTVVIGTKPAAYTSDTTGTYNMVIGQNYTFKITSSDGSVPPFVVASNGATVAPYTKSGNNYYFKVTGAKAGDFGVYVGNRVCVLHITSGVTCDTKTVTIANGKTYQFKVTAPKAPTFVVAGVGTVKPVKVEGNNYFYKVMNDGAAGQYGVYINGARMAVITCTK